MRISRESRVRLPSVAPAVAAYAGREVIAGLRAEAFTLVREGVQPGPTQRAVAAHVEVLEPTGADTLVVLTLGGQEFTARLEPDVPLRPGQDAQFVVDLARLVCFDPQTEALIA
jgi:multiple sugar transport system ATP-binding protein